MGQSRKRSLRQKEQHDKVRITREQTEKWNQMTALRDSRHEKFLASSGQVIKGATAE